MAVSVAVQHDDGIDSYEDVDKAIYNDGTVQLHFASGDSDEVDGEIFGATDGQFRIFVKPPADDAQVKSFGEATFAMHMPNGGIKVNYEHETLTNTEMSQYVDGTILNVRAYDD